MAIVAYKARWERIERVLASELDEPAEAEEEDVAVNLSPFFSVTPYSTSGGWWVKFSAPTSVLRAEPLGDGWVRLWADATSAVRNIETCIPRVEAVENGGTYTLLSEWRNAVPGWGGSYARNYAANCQFSSNGYKPFTSGYGESGERRTLMTCNSTNTGAEAWNGCINLMFQAAKGYGETSIECRLSLYEGDYDGPYVPYLEQRVEALMAARAAQAQEGGE